MKKYDIVGGLIWLILGIALCIESIRLSLGHLHRPGPGFVSFLSGAFLGLFGLVLLLSNLKGLRKEERLTDIKIGVKKNWKNFIFTLLLMIGYFLLLETLGFLLTSFLFLFFSFKLTKPKKWLGSLILAVSAIIVSYIIFIFLLKCPFPKGIFRLG
jgi:putative tricarboxylic transport membrane protein